ncbi:MAG: type I-E CRISPR-associated protein Cas5/CasD [Phycisphaerales bacterium]|nr:type I-E CRISPR-associated protein Cas5/CasD [Phycisphaerales bacterium]
MTALNTLYLRLEGPLQAWGDTSKFVIRRSMDAPTKSGVLGLICCALGLSRAAARDHLAELNTLTMGVRLDRPGTRWWDYHTVGAKCGLMRADGKGIKHTASTGEIETLVTRREYLADAGFLVALQGEAELIGRVASALAAPVWPVFLGRRSCPPSVPVRARPFPGEGWANPSSHDSLPAALSAVPLRPRCQGEAIPAEVATLIEWRPAGVDDIAPDEAEVWYDTPVSFDPPVHQPRLVLRGSMAVDGGPPVLRRPPSPPRPRADYKNAEYRKRRAARLEADHGLCVFCKNAATTVQHITYRRAGGNEAPGDLCALCRLCHDAVTMIEYGMGLGLDRIDPTQPRWRDEILRTRGEILSFRSEDKRRRALREALREAPEDIRREVLEEGEA